MVEKKIQREIQQSLWTANKGKRYDCDFILYYTSKLLIVKMSKIMLLFLKSMKKMQLMAVVNVAIMCHLMSS